jgi:hypothetical protein
VTPSVRSRPADVKRVVCNNREVVLQLRRTRASLLAAATALLAVAPVAAGRGVPSLPSEIPPATRQRLALVTDGASLATHVDGEPFRARHDIFEYLLDHLEFATHVTRTLRTARYRIWRVPGGFGLDDGWGTVGTFEMVYTAPGIRVLHAKGEYQNRLLPNIQGQAIISLTYAATPSSDGTATIAAAVDSYVKLDSKVMVAAGILAHRVAHAKAEKEGRRLVRTFARTTRAIEEDPAALWQALRQRPDVPRRELEEFRRLLSLPPVAEPTAAIRH